VRHSTTINEYEIFYRPLGLISDRLVCKCLSLNLYTYKISDRQIFAHMKWSFWPHLRHVFFVNANLSHVVNVVKTVVKTVVNVV
jgi:hypothetical protein